MWRSSSLALALMGCVFCAWLWLVQPPHTSSQEVITVSLISVKNTSSADMRRKKKHISIPRIMLDLYEQAAASRHLGGTSLLPDVVRGLTPKTTGGAQSNL